MIPLRPSLEPAVPPGQPPRTQFAMDHCLVRLVFNVSVGAFVNIFPPSPSRITAVVCQDFYTLMYKIVHNFFFLISCVLKLGAKTAKCP